MSKLALCLTMITTLILMAPSCPNGLVTITYHQVGACNGGATADGEYNAGVNQAYAVFAIESIDNSQNQNAFAYDPSKIVWTSNTKDSFDSNLEIYRHLIGPFATAPMTVSAKASIGFNPNGYGALVVQTVAQDGASEANNTSYFLSYKGSGSTGNPTILLTKSNANQTSWRYTPNCADIALSQKTKTK